MKELDAVRLTPASDYPHRVFSYLLVLGGYPKFRLKATPKRRQASFAEAGFPSEPTGLTASGVLRQNLWARTRRLPYFNPMILKVSLDLVNDRTPWLTALPTNERARLGYTKVAG